MTKRTVTISAVALVAVTAIRVIYRLAVTSEWDMP